MTDLEEHADRLLFLFCRNTREIFVNNVTGEYKLEPENCNLIYEVLKQVGYKKINGLKADD